MLSFDPYALKARIDPYPLYATLRAEAPVYFVAEHGFWMLTRWADCYAATGDPRFSAARGIAGVDAFPGEGDLPPWAHSLSSTDPPDHTRLRRLVQTVFNPRSFRRWEGQVRGLAEALVDDLLEASRDDSADLAVQVARQLPTAVVMELFDLPRADHDMLDTWSRQAVKVLRGMANVSVEVAMEAFVAAAGLADYCTNLIAERSTSVRDDLISQLIQARDEATGEGLTADEILGTVFTLVMGGIETTSSLIANGAVALARHPAQYLALRERRGLVPIAVEEMLRWDAPVQMTFRTTVEALGFGGSEIPAEARVALVWGSANRDQDQNPDSGSFCILRDKAPNQMAFGIGTHFCLGANLARLEARAAFEALLEQVARIECREEPTVDTDLMPVVRTHTKVPVDLVIDERVAPW